MSINVPIKVGKSSPRSKTIENDVNKPNFRKYNVRRDDDNQSNRWRGGVDRRTEEPPPEYRYKSYDYLPMKYLSDGTRNERRVRKDISHSPTFDKYRRPSHVSHSRRLSSSEDLDYSHYSSENSRKHSFKASNPNPSHGDCMVRHPRKNYDNYKYSSCHKDYDKPDTYNTRSYHNSSIEKPKKASFSANYANNNRSNTVKSYSSNFPSDDYKYLKRIEDDNDNYSRHNDKNAMTLKSTYRRDENIPHSGTRLETHRKQIDKYCTGSHYNESHNSDRGLQYKTNLLNKNKKTNKCPLLPPSPKYCSTRKSCSLEKDCFDNHKNRYHSSHRTRGRHHEGVSDDESCYFENCRNSNNEFLTKKHLANRNDSKESYTSHSDYASSSVNLSNEKPTESIPIALSSAKVENNVNSGNRNLHEGAKSNTSCSQRKDNGKECANKHRHSCRSSRHHSAHMYH